METKETKTVIVSRHVPTILYLIEKGIAPEDSSVLRSAIRHGDVQGKHVIGNLPLSLAAEADCVTVVPLPRAERLASGRFEKISLRRLRREAGTPSTYRVTKIR